MFGRRRFIIKTDHVLPDRCRTDERRHVARHATFFQILQILRERIPFDVVFDVGLLTKHMFAYPIVEWPHRFAFAHNLSRHALPDLTLRSAVLNQRGDGPGKHIDKPGRHGESLRVNNRFCLCRFEITDSHDPIAANCDIGLFRLGTGAVVNRAVFNDNVKIWRW